MRRAADRLQGGDMTAQDGLQVLVDDEAAQISREKPSTMENSQTMRLTPGSSVNTTSKWAKSTCACSPGGVSKRTSKGLPGWPDVAHASLRPCSRRRSPVPSARATTAPP